MADASRPPRDADGSTRRAVLLRLDAAVHDALQRWAKDELRSVNAQVEFVLRRALQREGRLRPGPPEPRGEGDGRDTAEAAD